MREAFVAWYQLDDQERRHIYREGLIVLDTNALLDLYRFTSAARQEVLALLRKVADRLWMPYQVGLEFHRNRLGVIHDASGEHRRASKAVEEAWNKLRSALEDTRSRTGMDRQSLNRALEQSFGPLRDQLKRLRDDDFLTLGQAISNDPILDEVTLLYEGRVGKAFSPDRLAEETRVGLERLENKVPPGFEDKEKEKRKGDPLGDYFIWRQIIDAVKERQKPLLFVTQEQKPDWYRIEHGHTVGPRRELIEEMLQETGIRPHFG
jgi:hypothetical protein